MGMDLNVPDGHDHDWYILQTSQPETLYPVPTDTADIKQKKTDPLVKGLAQNVPSYSLPKANHADTPITLAHT